MLCPKAEADEAGGGGRMYLLKWGTVIEQRKECSYDLAGYMERRTGGIGDGS